MVEAILIKTYPFISPLRLLKLEFPVIIAPSYPMHLDLSSYLAILILAILASQARASISKLQHNPVTDKPECTFPRLKERLMRTISLDDPFAFEIILHSECRGNIDTASHHHLQLFDNLLTLSQTRDVSDYLNMVMKDESYNPFMFETWLNHRPLLSHHVLLALKANFRYPESSKIFIISLEYPAGSPERLLLSSWLVELQRPMLNWPFAPTVKESSGSASPVKVKSFRGVQSWSDFENVPGISRITQSDEGGAEVEETESKTPDQNLRFGHIYGWISRRNRPAVCNSQDHFYLCGHAVKLHDTFLSFASPKFHLEDFAKSAKSPSKSFFGISNGSLRQKLTQSATNKNFAACRLKGGSGELQATLKGNLMLVVLGRRGSGEYDYKYPENPYDYFVNGSRDLQDISVEVAPSDIVLFLPRSLFSNSQQSIIRPHDISGSFHHTELSTFASTFVNFINYVHLKTSHHGLIAVGGFVHIAS